MFDKTLPIRFIFLNWILVVTVSPIVLLMYLIDFDSNLIVDFNFSTVTYFLVIILWSLFFSLPSILIFGILVSFLINFVHNEKFVKIFLIAVTWLIIHFTFILYFPGAFLRQPALTATFVYWIVSIFTIWFIPLNKD